ncbi:MAG TPA: DUF4287 domain-containing protein [Vicinamibacteria bacterium]|nr:DUF4287 domain-containing protein [Vicinamibacteria bacterium]
MTKGKHLKRAVRARAAKTGESYSSARRHLLEARRRRSARVAPAVTGAGVPVPAPTPSSSPAPRSRGARRTTGEASVREKTGRSLAEWFDVLDAFGAADKGHTASARHLREDHGVPSWHCQMITVEYERARGLRSPNQSCDGDFQVSVSRTLAATVVQVARAFAEARQRRRWLQGADPRLARALEAALTADPRREMKLKTPQDARLRYRWEESTVEIRVTGKPGGKAAIVAANTGLADAGDVERRRQAWSEALAGLRQHLAG